MYAFRCTAYFYFEKLKGNTALKKEHIKSFILILLVINSIQLTVQIWFGGGILDSGFNPTGIFSFLGHKNSVLSEQQLYKNAVMPRRIIINGGGAREVYFLGEKDYDTAYSYTEKTFESFSKNNITVSKRSYDEWKNLFKGKSLYVDFGYDFDCNGLNDLLGISDTQNKFEQFLNASGVLIYPDQVMGKCSYNILDKTDNTVYEFEFECNCSEMLDYITDTTYAKQQNYTFAFEINLDTASQSMGNVEQMVELSPMTLLYVSSDAEKGKTLVCRPMFENTQEIERFAEKTLPVFGYNSSLLRKTVSGDGTVVYVENNATIKYYSDGTVEYSAVSDESGLKVSNGKGNVKAISDTLKIVKELLDTSEFDISLMNLHYSSELIDNKNNNYTVRLNNMYNGAVINYDNISNSAVSAEIKNGYITNFVIHFVPFEESDENCDTIPVLSAIDKLYFGHSGKMIINDVVKCYDFKTLGAVELKWGFSADGDTKLMVVDND